MNLKFIDDCNFDVYLRKELLNYNFFDKKELLENYLKNIIKKLKKVYDLKIGGFYNITIYVDKYYGAVFHFEKEDLDYYDCFKESLEIQFVLKKVEFLYLVDNIMDEFKSDTIVDKNGLIYIKLNKKPTNKNFMNLIEHANIIYDKHKV